MNTIINENSNNAVETKVLSSHIDTLLGQTMSLLSEWEVEYGHNGVKTNLETWADNKHGLYAVMKNSPHWNEKLLSIVADFEYEPTIIAYEVQNALDSILWHVGDTFRLGFRDHIGTFPIEASINSDFAQRVNNLITRLYPDSRLKFSDGQKTTRAMRKLFILGGAQESDKDFMSLFNKFAESMDTSPKKSKIVLSIHPHSFLLMSNGNQWSSCHNINGDSMKTSKNCGSSYNHCYRRGTLSYMNDAPTFIVYGLNEVPSDENEILSKPKNFRQAFHVGFDQGEDGVQGMLMMQSRLYPWGNDNPLSTAVRSIVSRLMSECVGLKSKRIRKRGMDGFYQEESSHYADYEHSVYGASVLKFGNVDNILSRKIGIGCTTYCLECGNECDEDDKSELSCSDCGGYGVTCERCGDRIYDDQTCYMHDIGEVWCSDCCDDSGFHCSYCGEPNTIDNMHDVEGEGWCSDCADRHSWYCESCDTNHHSNTTSYQYADGRGMTCYDGVQDDEFICSACSEVFEASENNGNDYCSICDEKRSDRDVV